MMKALVLLSAAGAQARVVVTVQDLFQTDHRVQIAAGTEVVWGDPHFQRVWFPSGAPAITRTPEGFRTVLSKDGTYRGVFTIVSGHGSEDVYSLIVTVSDR